MWWKKKWMLDVDIAKNLEALYHVDICHVIQFHLWQHRLRVITG